MSAVIASEPRVVEFFAGIGLVRLAVESIGARVVWANDIEETKRALYAENMSAEHFVCDDVRNVLGEDLPDAEIATASFPCVDLSLAGNRLGLTGRQSGMFWEFARVIDEMGARRPKVVMLENVPGFATSRGGADLLATLECLNRLGYTCDLLALDARRFVPQSRLRLFIIGSSHSLKNEPRWAPHVLRPAWTRRLADSHPELKLVAFDLPDPPESSDSLADIVERLRPQDEVWWEPARLSRFEESLSPIQARRLARAKKARTKSWATAYRRTRDGVPRWEIRGDTLAGCLRTARGGSSKQAVVEAGAGQVRVRWMTPREYARLQGVPDNYRLNTVSENQALFGLGDAVCVPAVAWLARHCLRPLAAGHAFTEPALAAA